jgi:hypothetical protein
MQFVGFKEALLVGDEKIEQTFLCAMGAKFWSKKVRVGTDGMTVKLFIADFFAKNCVFILNTDTYVVCVKNPNFFRRKFKNRLK